MLQPNLFQLFQPIGGRFAKPLGVREGSSEGRTVNGSGTGIGSPWAKAGAVTRIIAAMRPRTKFQIRSFIEPPFRNKHQL